MVIDLNLLLPEIFTGLLGVGLLVLFFLWRGEGATRVIGYLAAAGLAVATVLAYQTVALDTSTLQGTWLADPLAGYFKVVFLLTGVMVALLSLSYLERLGESLAEFFIMLVFLTLSMMVVISAGDLITLYLALEFQVITFAVMIGYRRREKAATEAALKYIILNAFSSAILLFGLSLLFGLTGTVNIRGIAAAVSAGGVQPALYLAVIFVLAGLAFKVSLVPFHMWTPDVYQGAPTPITGFLAAGSKAAGFALLIRLFLTIFTPVSSLWTTVFVVLSVLTIVLGNFVAVPQTNMKRLLAYASIGSAGYIIMGLIAADVVGVEGILFYIFMNVFGILGAFGVAIVFGNATGRDDIEAYAGLSKRSPLLALVMLLSTLSIAGIPGLAGFVAKFVLFWAIIDKGLVALALLGVVMSIVAVFYFLRIAKVMYVFEPEDEAPIRVAPTASFVLVISMVVTLVLGVYPAPLLDLAREVALAVLR